MLKIQCLKAKIYNNMRDPMLSNFPLVNFHFLSIFHLNSDFTSEYFHSITLSRGIHIAASIIKKYIKKILKSLRKIIFKCVCC